MNIKKLIKNIGFILVLLLIGIFIENLNSICLNQAKITMSIKYSYFALFSSLIGYAIMGFILGFDNILKECRKKGKLKIDYIRIMGLSIPSLIIGLLPLIYLFVYKSTIKIPYNIFFLIFGFELSKSITKNDL